MEKEEDLEPAKAFCVEEYSRRTRGVERRKAKVIVNM